MAFKRRTKKLEDLEIVEASGVDHPAHLHEGWIVQKSTLTAALDEVADTTTPDTGAEMELETTAIEIPVEDAEAPQVEAVHLEATEDVEVRKELDHLRKELDAATAKADALEDERAMEKATVRVAAWGILPEVTTPDFAPVFRSLRSKAPEETVEIEKILDACAQALSEAGIFKELGTDAEADSDAWDQINALAKAKVGGDGSTTLEAAIGTVAAENPDLYKRYLNERG